MDESLAGLIEGTGASAPSPALSAADIEKIKSELRAEIEKSFQDRIGGFQTAINRLTEENRQLKTSALSDEEREQLAVSEAERYIEELERKVALADLAAQSPDVAPVYRQLIEAATPEEQLDILRGLIKPAAAEAEAVVGEVDRNNPAPTFGAITGRLPDGTPLSGDTAWEMLRQMGPGAVAEIR